MPLFGDEAYYLLWADRLAPAYYDHPAGTAVMLWLSTRLWAALRLVLGEGAAAALPGQGEFGVRWLNALLSTACVPLAYQVGRRYVSGAGGLVAAAALAFGPVYVLTGRVVYPDALQTCLMLLNLLAARPLLGQFQHEIRAPRRSATAVACGFHRGVSLEGRARPWQWVWFGATLALLLNVRLTSGFYAVGLALYVLGFRRDLLRVRGFWLAAGIVALGLIPVAAWNVTRSWTMVRLAMSQGQGFGLPGGGLARSLAHAWRYLSPPMALLAACAAVGAAAVGLNRIWDEIRALSRSVTGVRCTFHFGLNLGAWRDRLRPDDTGSAQTDGGPALLLVLVAACLILPVMLSAANSPRNLGLGLAALWPLAGARIRLLSHRPVRLLLAVLCAATALYGLGTAMALLGPTRLPHSPAADSVRWDAAGWPEFAREIDLPADALTFTVDYSSAGQVSYYAGISVYSAMGQFRVWGFPEASDWTVLALPFVPADLIAERLAADFASVAGPRSWRYAAAGIEKTVYVWQARGRRVPTDQVVEDLDYLAVAQAAAQRAVLGIERR